MVLFFRMARTIECSVLIRQPIDTVFEFYRDFRNLPRFLGDVTQIEIVDDHRSRWTIRSPIGFDIHWTVSVTETKKNSEIAYETRCLVTPVRWRISFIVGPEAASTEVREVMQLPGGWLAEKMLASIGKPPKGEVEANLQRLKEMLEQGYEPRRVCRRLQLLRKWSRYEQDNKQIFT